jgi:hypothetical protein
MNIPDGGFEKGKKKNKDTAGAGTVFFPFHFSFQGIDLIIIFPLFYFISFEMVN